MSRHAPLLAEPIRARVDRDGRLLAADPELLRWHWQAGGREGGTIALPALAALVAESLRLNMRLSDQVEIGDEDADLSLWVETCPDEEGLSLAIVSRTAQPVRPAGRMMGQPARPAPATGGIEVQLDPAGRILHVGAGIAGLEAGREFANAVRLHPGADGRLRLIEALPERQPFAGQALTIGADGSRWIASGGPLADRSGSFAGTLIHLVREDAAEAGAGSGEAAGEATPEPLLGDRFLGTKLAPALRQPLGRIVAQAETIGAQLAGPIRHSYAGYARDIAEAARHLVALLDDLADLEMLDRPDFAPARDAIDLADCARRAAGLLAVRAADRSIRIDAEALMPLAATGEYRRVLQILVNLVGNAVRYGPEASAIRLSGEDRGAAVLLHVDDAGAGVDPADRERIFEKFERLGREGDGGSGLGLFIARRLARAMDGELSVDRSDLGGARFTLRLPGRA